MTAFRKRCHVMFTFDFYFGLSFFWYIVCLCGWYRVQGIINVFKTLQLFWDVRTSLRFLETFHRNGTGFVYNKMHTLVNNATWSTFWFHLIFCYYFNIFVFLFSKRDVPSATYILHSAHCARHLVICKKCMESVPRISIEDHDKEVHGLTCCTVCKNQIEKSQLDGHLVSYATMKRSHQN